MAKIELVRFLSDSAGDALNKAQDVKPETAKELLDEAEELFKSYFNETKNYIEQIK